MMRVARLFCVMTALLLASTSWSQGFDFGKEGGSDPGDARLADIVMPDGSRPIIASFFIPVDGTEASILRKLNDALVENLNAFEDFDAVNGLAIKLELEAMGEEGEACAYDAACLAEQGAALGVQYVVVGRLYMEGEQYPRISLDRVSVEEGVVNVLEFEVSESFRKQREQLEPAAYRLFDKPLPGIEDIRVPRPREEPPRPLPDWQMWTAIGCGVGAIGFFTTGIIVGADSQNLEADIAIGVETATRTQREIQALSEEAEQSALIANVMYGLGGLALAAGVLFLVIRPEAEVAEPSPAEPSDDAGVELYISPQFSPEGGGLIGTLRF